MKFIIYFILFIFFMGPKARAHKFCFSTFNAYGPAYSTELKLRSKYLTRALNSQDQCDFVQLQEVWTESHLLLIKQELENYFYFTPNEKYKSGLMSLSLHEISGEEFFYFNKNYSLSGFDLVRKSLNIKKGFSVNSAQPSSSEEKIYFINTHLHPSNSAIRISQIIDIYKWRTKHLDQKLILSGDFNADPNSIEIRLIKTLLAAEDTMISLFKNYDENFCTYCKSNPRSWMLSNHVFDYIFYSNQSPFKSQLIPLKIRKSFEGFSGFTLSDHFGLTAHYKLEKSDIEFRSILDKKTLQEAINILIHEEDEFKDEIHLLISLLI